MSPLPLYRPVGPTELALIRGSGFRCFPPRLVGQPIFYPVLTESDARQIARQWKVPEAGAGFVTRFSVDERFAAKYRVHCVGGPAHRELWVPAEDLAEFNRHIVGLIEVVAGFTCDASADGPALTARGDLP